AGRGKGWQFGAGWGGHVPIGKMGAFMDIDIAGYAILQGLRVTERPGGLGQLRLLFGWQAFERLSMFAGPTLSVLVSRMEACPTDGGDACMPGDEEPALKRPGYGWTVWDRRTDDGGPHIRLWPGFAAGLRF
ncbi:MAG: hypothetical protein IAG13_16460, partial [Deltaproteobacteria bacterium]|nr:hypothetical protein [Nannocystaceae bacterium]